MNKLPHSSSSPSSRRHRSRWLALFVFGAAMVAGAGLCGIRWMVRGNADPFAVDWPLYLQLGSSALTVVMAIVSRRPFSAALGIYCGLVVFMLVDGNAEYPVASVIALTVHGLIPALLGALFVYGWLRWRGATAKDVNATL